MDPVREVETARLLLEAARYLGETLDPHRVYERFREIMAEAIPHDGVVVSSFEPEEGLIRCEYAWVDGELLDPAIFPPFRLKATGGMQSEVIRTGRPLLTNDVATRVQDSGTYYDVDSEGSMTKVPDHGPPKAQAAMMVPIKHEGRVAGVVQLMSDHTTYEEGQLELAEAIVAQLAAAVRNARLHEERLELEASAAAAEAVAREREHATQVLEAVGDGILFVSADGVVGFWNRAAESITGMTRESVRGRTLAELGVDWTALADRVRPAEGHRRPRAVTLPVQTGARELWLSFLGVRTRDGVVYTFRDTTAERHLEESKHEFIATVSHELRTPMTGVLGAARTLLRDDLELPPESTRELLEMIAAQAQRLSDVTDGLLLADRLERDEVAVEARRVDVDRVVGETVAALGPTLPASVRLEPRPGSPQAAVGDAARLQQVLINLVENAARYSPHGGTISVRSSDAGDRVRIEVADQGVGIPAADRERIFEKFYRSESSRSLAPSGSGLGLYICRGLLERMGGTIAVTSVPGVGSTFTVELAAAPGGTK